MAKKRKPGRPRLTIEQRKPQAEIKVRCSPDEKARWMEMATDAGGLSELVRSLLERHERMRK